MLIPCLYERACRHFFPQDVSHFIKSSFIIFLYYWPLKNNVVVFRQKVDLAETEGASSCVQDLTSIHNYSGAIPVGGNGPVKYISVTILIVTFTR